MYNIRDLVDRCKIRVINLVFKLREKQSIINKIKGYAKAIHLIEKIDIYKDLNRAELNLNIQIELNQIIKQKWFNSKYISIINKLNRV